MKTINTYLIAGLSLFCSSPVFAAPSHLGVEPSQHVALELTSDVTSICPNDRSFYKIFPTGVRATTVYQVPVGKYLVVTDVVWVAVPSPTSFTPGRVVTMRLDVYNPTGTYNGTPFRSPPQLITSEHGSMVGNSEHLTAGVRIEQRKLLCAYAISESESAGAVNTVRKAIIYGYEIDKP